MKINIYHGSIFVIEKPIFGYGNPHNDYGLGFYCTKDLDLAKEWACQHGIAGYANKYELNVDKLNILDLTDRNKYNVLNWIAVLLHFRSSSFKFKNEYQEELDFMDSNYYVDVSMYDVVIGYRADDAYFAFPKAFVSNQLTIEKLEEIYLNGSLDKKIVLLSKKSFDSINFVCSIKTEKNDFFSYKKRIESANNKYYEIIRNDRRSLGKRLRDLMFGESKND